MHDDIILEMRGITKTFPGVKALDDVNLQVRRHEIHALCGENGAGKSTLMKVLSGVYPHGTYDGSILYDGEEMRFSSIRESEQQGIIIIHQELALVPILSIAENIFLGNEIAKRGVIDWHEMWKQTEVLLNRVGLKEKPQTRVDQIGVGKQQLVEIAKALSKDVKLLILDEPTAALQEKDAETLLKLMRELRDRGITCIMISHKLNEIAEVADNITVIRDGHTVSTMPSDRREVLENRIIRDMVGRDLNNRYPARASHIGETLLEVQDWSVRHPIQTDRTIINDVNLNVRAGEVVGIAGLMGSGRTELAMSIFGRSWGGGQTGNVLIDGKMADVSTVPRAIDAGLAYVTEDRKSLGLILDETIVKNTTLAALPKISRRGVLDDTRERHVAEDYRRQLRTRTPSVFQKAGNLSGGNQQKVVLAKWLFSDPKVLILDEPTRGIDVGAKFEIYNIINELAGQGRGVLMISSEMPELLGMCDRIYVMNEGRFVGELTREQASQERIMEAIINAEKVNNHVDA
ncbi:multiple monosaccharide ABC transporter ATP-binding protein [Notoacmeibacter sp. MSK16QG-6]|uniref:multiple monosaccharide ABC transporter ATP-binding protein n=1 Tax=Notoacmeibacter sp. MSK16QG-6 TaxID=2957982 RepID=UPI00209FD2DB|nr:multiple monosaccharide ABC transporter ATP-binding protein [Notoacmeibacter sp. MSK16QG-6]MCP1200260.1 sugar ABC transporter ATP-binding protein [Notoacmeibacter sp. MSK16QG-6]